MKGISVIIPVYNQEKFIYQAIESVLNQNYSGKLEVIISDDGSTDRTLEVAEFFLPKVIILRKSSSCNSQGVSGARNRGILAATQEYICFLDSDDFYLPEHLTKISRVLECNTNIGFAFCRMLEVKEIEGTLKCRDWTQKIITKNDILNPALSRSHVVSTNTFIFKNEVFVTAGLFNENYSNGEDGDLWMRISELFKGRFSDHYGAIYRTNHSSLQLTNNRSYIIDQCSMQIYTAALNRYYKLKLKNTYRLYKIKQILLFLKKSDSKLYYYVKYMLLILHNPIQFVKQQYELYLYHKFMRKNKYWKDFRDVMNANF